MIRDDIKAALVTAMKGGDKATTGTLRMVSSAIKNRDIELRTGAGGGDDDAMVTEVLQKMIKQRRESVDLYRKGAREELAAAEEAEIAIIERFLPTQMSDEEAKAAIAAQRRNGESRMLGTWARHGLAKERSAPHRASAGERVGQARAVISRSATQYRSSRASEDGLDFLDKNGMGAFGPNSDL